MSKLRVEQLSPTDDSKIIVVSQILQHGEVLLSELNYTAPFTGSVQTTQDKKNSEHYSLFDAGGKGDGTTNEDAAITKYLAANNNILVVPRGTWLISTALDLDGIVFQDGAAITSSSAVTVKTKSIQAPEGLCFGGSVSITYAGRGLVEWFGAKGDGVTDDLAAFKKAYAGCAGLSLKGKTYLLSDTFEIKKPFILSGMSPEVTVITSSNSAKDIVAVTSVNGVVGDDNAAVKLDGFTVKYTGSATPTAGAGINVTYCSYASVTNVKIRNTYNGLYHTTALGCVFEGISILSCYNDAIFMDTNSIDFVVRNVIIDGQTGYATGVRRTNVGVYIYGALVEGWVVDSVRCTMCKQAMLLDATLSTARNCPSFGRVSKCFFDTANVTSLFAKCREITVDNSWFSSNASDSGLSLGVTHGVSFSQCQFINNAQHGLILSASANFTVINNCQFSSNSAASTTGSGIVITAATNNFTITNNLFDNSSLSATQKWGVFVNAGTSTNYIIAFNQCYGNVSGGVSDGGTGSQKLVQTNFT